LGSGDRLDKYKESRRYWVPNPGPYTPKLVAIPSTPTWPPQQQLIKPDENSLSLMKRHIGNLATQC